MLKNTLKPTISRVPEDSSLSESTATTVHMSRSGSNGFQTSKGKDQSLNTLYTYGIAGQFVAACHSQFHQVNGQLELDGQKDISENIKLDPEKWAKNGGYAHEPEFDHRVQLEKAVLEISGYQTVLLQCTIDPPTDQLNDFVVTEQGLREMIDNRSKKGDLTSKELMVHALGMVTRHWFEIWNLANYFTQKKEKRHDCDHLKARLREILNEKKRFILY